MKSDVKDTAKHMREMEAIPSEKFKYRCGSHLNAKLITPLNAFIFILPWGSILWLSFHLEGAQARP